MIGPRFKRGDWVVYVPGVAAGDPNHDACERGTVSRVSGSGDLVFVTYGEELHAKATSPTDLFRAEDVMASGGAQRSSQPIVPGTREYIGDGVFAGLDGAWQVVMTAENGIRATDIIYLEPAVFAALVRWHKSVVETMRTRVMEG